ncbi:MAG: hypothetical protein VYC97_09060 [SAR324 cluster bacterium]|nr:hypothetical protein [SAR324 cluster bacterium]
MMNQTTLVYDEVLNNPDKSKTFRVSATGSIGTVYNPFDGILI